MSEVETALDRRLLVRLGDAAEHVLAVEADVSGERPVGFGVERAARAAGGGVWAHALPANVAARAAAASDERRLTFSIMLESLSWKEVAVASRACRAFRVPVSGDKIISKNSRRLASIFFQGLMTPMARKIAGHRSRCA